MPLFQCQVCGCVDNTAPTDQGFRCYEDFDWSYAPERRGLQLCVVCGPVKLSSKEYPGPTDHQGVWHNLFPRRFLPKGEYFTNRRGNIEHRASGEHPTLDKYSDTEFT